MQNFQGKLSHVVYLCKDVFVFFILFVYYYAESFMRLFIPRKYRSKCVKGEIVLITGAGGGIGRLIALKFAKLGAIVVVWDINKDGVKTTIDLIKDYGGEAHGFTCDLTKPEEIYKTAEVVKKTIGPVDILINNAGIVFGKTLLELPDNEINTTFQVNILAHYWTTKAFLQDMMKNNHGQIVTVASVAGLLGTYRCTDYSATKFAAVGFHESLFTELKANGYDGIHLTLICPYYINTGMFNGVKPRLMDMLEPEAVAEESVAAILANEINVTLPTCVRYFLPLKCFLPDKLCWALMYHVMQGPQSMMAFKGRENDAVKSSCSTVVPLTFSAIMYEKYLDKNEIRQEYFHKYQQRAGNNIPFNNQPGTNVMSAGIIGYKISEPTPEDLKLQKWYKSFTERNPNFGNGFGNGGTSNGEPPKPPPVPMEVIEKDRAIALKVFLKCNL